MNEARLKEILEQHQLWLNDEDGGIRCERVELLEVVANEQ